MHSALPARHMALALLITAIWGSNFVIVKWAFAYFPPLLFAALRFLLVVVPMIFFVRRPAVPLANLIAFGVLIGAGQFGLMFWAMRDHISPGLVSLVIQTQVFFTIAIAARISGERFRPLQWLALAVAASGMALIAANVGGSVTVVGLITVLIAAMAWASANIISRRASGVNLLGYIVWSSVAALPPLFALSFIFEGSDVIVQSIRSAPPLAWLAVLWQSFGNTVFGYGLWAWLLARYPAATISPWALLVPVFGMLSAAFWLGEPLPPWKLMAAALVMAGLALNVLATRRPRA